MFPSALISDTEATGSTAGSSDCAGLANHPISAITIARLAPVMVPRGVPTLVMTIVILRENCLADLLVMQIPAAGVPPTGSLRN